MKKTLVFFWEIAKIVIIALLIVVPIRYFIFQPFFVKGQSMEPNFESGDYLIVDEISYRFRDPQQGEVVVFKYPNDPSQRYIKRIIGLPGEIVEIKNGQVIVFNQEGGQVLDESDYLSSYIFTPGNVRITLAEDEYFVLGDNRSSSADSRRWGPLSREYIVGRVLLRAWPLAALAKIEAPEY
jgi:signal peptidase I